MEKDKSRLEDVRPLEKVCARCGVLKKREEFRPQYLWKRGKIGLYSYCNPCYSDIRKEWRKQGNNYEKDKARSRKYLLAKYGLTPEDYDALKEKQGERCAICRKKRPLHVDHCHTGGQVRGLLCAPCNTGLGSFSDSKKNLIRAVAYLAGRIDFG